MEGNLPEEDHAMTKTLNPTITVTVSGPTGSGKSRVLASIASMLSLTYSNCTIEAPDVEAEIKNRGNNHLNWHKARSGTIFKLEEINQPINTGRYPTHDIETAIKKIIAAQENLVKAETEIRNKAQAAITIEDLFDRPAPVHIQKLMNKLGVFIEGPEYQEADLQPVVDLVNWALTTPPIPEQATQPDKKENEYSSRNPDCLSGVTNKDRKNAPQVTLLAQEDIIQRAVESVITLLDYRKQQQIYHEELAEKIRKELLNLHNRLG
ncbi:hypothetical protein DY703_14695 [Salmonella enterica]|nr:hypothetical protein [Salmonella enterica]EBN6861407.1 hypothetical protein [Salmonella enterica]ECU7995154.1 hypothetical protein [Salmonella enterica subsp. enterica serovar Toucra]